MDSPKGRMRQSWGLPEGIKDLPDNVQTEIHYALQAKGPDAPGLTDAAREYMRTLHHHARTGTKIQNVLLQHDWDVLLDGRPHQVDLVKDLWVGSIHSFRTKVYREARARGLCVLTKGLFSDPHPKVPVFVVQARELAADLLADPNQPPLLAPWYRSQATAEELAIALVPPVPDPVPVAAPAPASAPVPDVDLAAMLGPCTCGAGFEADASPHAPSCSIWGG